MQLDFKSDSVQFARDHGCPPAFIIEEAMKHGASVGIEAATNEIKTLRLELNKLQRLSAPQHDIRTIPPE